MQEAIEKYSAEEKEKINEEREEVLELDCGVRKYIQSQKERDIKLSIPDKHQYKSHHEEELGIVRDLAEAENRHRDRLIKNNLSIKDKVVFGAKKLFGINAIESVSSKENKTFINNEASERTNSEVDKQLLNLELKEAKVSISHDKLTGLYNRAALEMLLPQNLEERLAVGEDCSVIFIDFDDFKQVNDTYGHLDGDHALKTLANVMSSVGFLGDSIFRYGGEEFVVYLPGKNSEAALRVAEKLREKVAETPIMLGGNLVTRTISLGVAGTDNNKEWQELSNKAKEVKSPGHKHDDEQTEIKEGIKKVLNSILEKADETMIWAKHKGKNKAAIENFEVNNFTKRRKKLEAAWQEPNEVMDKIKEGFKNGLDLQEIVNDPYFKDKLDEAFKPKGKTFGCSDGRVREEGSQFKKIGTPGGGILLFKRDVSAKTGKLESNAEWIERLIGDKKNKIEADPRFISFVNSLYDQDVEEIVSHDDCGAAKSVAGNERGDDDGVILAQLIYCMLQEKDVSEIQKSNSKVGETEMLNLSKMKYKHLTINGDLEGENRMRREIHDERLLILDGTGNFDPDALGLPSNFLVSSYALGTLSEGVVEENLKEEELKKELEQELKILCGVVEGHGFGGKRFKEKYPFNIFVVANSQEQLKKLKEYANNVSNRIDSISIKVDGFVYDKKSQ